MIPIERSLIVGGEIWTYSFPHSAYGQLQANLMTDLSVSKKVHLPNLGIELIPESLPPTTMPPTTMPPTTTPMEWLLPTPTNMPVD